MSNKPKGPPAPKKASPAQLRQLKEMRLPWSPEIARCFEIVGNIEAAEAADMAAITGKNEGWPKRGTLDRETAARAASALEAALARDASLRKPKNAIRFVDKIFGDRGKAAHRLQISRWIVWPLIGRRSPNRNLTS